MARTMSEWNYALIREQYAGMKAKVAAVERRNDELVQLHGDLMDLVCDAEARVEELERRLLLVCVSAHRAGETCDLCATPTAEPEEP